MKEFIDIFSRLIIATITFVGPIIIFLLSTFIEGEKRRKDLSKRTQDEISKQAAQEFRNNPAKFRETIDKTSEEFKRIDKATNKELSRLNPFIQFWLIYGSLAISFFFLMFDYLIRDNYLGLYNHFLSAFLLIISGLMYLLSITFIIRVFYTIIRTKKIIEN